MFFADTEDVLLDVKVHVSKSSTLVTEDIINDITIANALLILNSMF